MYASVRYSCSPRSGIRGGLRKGLLGDIGDSQSIENELSTYSSRLEKMKVFLERADANALLLIDEFGSGTDPDLGSALAEEVLERLHGLQVRGRDHDPLQPHQIPGLTARWRLQREYGIRSEALPARNIAWRRAHRAAPTPSR